MEEENYENYVQQLEEELKQTQQERHNIAKAQLGMYEQSSPEDNIVKWQLNLEEEKERIYHLLKGHRKSIDAKGNEIWINAETSDSVLLNDYGVDYIMGLLESFLNRNIILSNFEDTRVEEICLDLANQMIEDIYNDYERMGLDTDDKRKKYPILIWKVIINVEASLRRAINNGERASLRKIVTVTQNDSPNRQPQYQMISNRGQRRLMHPSTWL